MAENKTKPADNKTTHEHNHAPHDHSHEGHAHSHEHSHAEHEHNHAHADVKDAKAPAVVTDNKDKKDSKDTKSKKPVVVKKEEAIAKGSNLPTSKKHCMYICAFIKNKSVDQSIKELTEVINMKRVIPFKGEIPHRSAPGIMSGRYPVNASKQFIYLLKALKGNVIANGMELNKTRIHFASATWDSRPARRGGTRFKRTFVLLKAKEHTYKETKEGKK